ncbi:MAG TPA: hypothetical protein VFZ53_14825 [Polyangiaceae bacterium]
MKPPSDLELMLYSDGELGSEHARRVRLARLCDARVGLRLGRIERVGDFVRAWAKSEGVDAPAVRRRALRTIERRRAWASVAAALVALAAVSEPAASRISPELAAASSPAVAIESVDFGERAGTVFVVETGSSATPVVWLSDDARAGG